MRQSLQFLGFSGSSGPSHVTCSDVSPCEQGLLVPGPNTVNVSSRAVSFSASVTADALNSDETGDTGAVLTLRRPGSARVCVDWAADGAPKTWSVAMTSEGISRQKKERVERTTRQENARESILYRIPQSIPSSLSKETRERNASTSVGRKAKGRNEGTRRARGKPKSPPAHLYERHFSSEARPVVTRRHGNSGLSV